MGECAICGSGASDIHRSLLCRSCFGGFIDITETDSAADIPGGVVYIASPYTHNDKEVMKLRYEQVQAFTARLMKRGIVAFSPIVHCHHLGERYGLPVEFSFWEKYCLSMLATADALWVLQLDGWVESVGVSAEIMFAFERGIPVGHEIDVSEFVVGDLS